MKQSDLTIENAKLISELKFEFQSHASYSTGGERWEVCPYKGLKLYVCTFTRRNGESWGKGKNTYYIDKEKKGYKDLNEFLNVVRERTSLTKV